MRIFISYPSRDGKPYANSLHDILKKCGHDPFLTDHNILFSEVFWDEIAKEILNRDLIIFIITCSSPEAKGQMSEYRLAVNKHRDLGGFVTDKAWNMKIVDKSFHWINPSHCFTFNETNLEEKCEKVSADLVKLQDRRGKVKIEKTDIPLKLPTDQRGLNQSEVDKSINNLFEGYQIETIIPEAFSTHESNDSISNFQIFGFNYRLPRKWFLKQEEVVTIYSNDILFRGFGRNIALAERQYICKLITQTKDIPLIEEVPMTSSDLLKRIDRAISIVRENGFEPRIIYPTLDHWSKLHKIVGEPRVRYRNVDPRPLLDAYLIVDGIELKVIHPLGKIPTHTMLLDKRAIKWEIKRSPEYGALHISMGNDRLYPMKYVQIMAVAIARCAVKPKGIATIGSIQKS